MKLFLIILSFACVCAANFAASGEIQGNVDNIKNIAVWQSTHKRMAIFDAGGFLVKDSLKSVEICSLMQRVRYSAIAVGEEELRFPATFWEEMNTRFSLPLVATNIKTNKKIFEKIRTVEFNRGGKYAVISVLGDENFADISKDYEITDAREAISEAINAIPQDYIIVLLAHCDPALTDSLLSEFERISYGVQGHRKRVSEPLAFSSNGKKILQFWRGGGQIAVLNKRGTVRWRIFVERRGITSPCCQEDTEEEIKDESAKISLILSKYKTPNLPLDYVLESTYELIRQLEIDTLYLTDSSSTKILEEFNIERIPALIFDKSVENLYNFPVLWQKLIEEPKGFVLDWGEIPDGEYYKREFRENEIVVIADSAGVEEIRPFLKENVEDWYLLTDNESEGFLIWWENRCLTTTTDIDEAKTLINYYRKIKGAL